LDYDFDFHAGPPTEWLRFLSQLWPNDPQSIATLQEWFGYCLTLDTRQQKILMMVGPKRSGKGTIARVLRRLIGERNVAGPTLSSLSEPFGLEPLLGKSVAIISDARLGGTGSSVVTERLLSISGEDSLSIGRKYTTAVQGKLDTRLKLGSSLHDLINEGHDIHKFIAAAVLDKNIEDVTKAERTGAKAVSFGRPGGMGVASLQRYAKNSFKQDLSVEEVQQRIDAYHRLCPELGPFLEDEVDSGLVIAETLGLTPAEYNEAIGGWANGVDADVPQGWLGGMLLRVLHEPLPVKRASGQPYSPAEIAFFWHKAQQLPLNLKPCLASKLERHEADEELWEAVRDWAGPRPVFTVTGRLRANALFGSSRNTPFQGPAADGAILGMWRLWRAGYKLVSAIHDQVVIETVADDHVLERKAEVERLMIEGMLAVVPGMNVRVETVVSLSLNKAELDPRYCEAK